MSYHMCYITSVKTAGLRELRQNASALIRQVEEDGEEIVITVAGRPSARLVPTARNLFRGPAGTDWETQGLFDGQQDSGTDNAPVAVETRTSPAEWIAAGHAHDDDQLPAPFDAVRSDSNNVGASVWIHVATGAMIAAIPTGRWKEPAQFAFYYAAPAAQTAMPLIGWTSSQLQWDGSDPNAYTRHHDMAIAYFNSRLGGYDDSEAPDAR